MRRGFIFLFIAISLLFGQVVYAGEKEKEWDVIKKASQKNATYTLMKSNATDELFLVKEKKIKGKMTEEFRSLLGTFDRRVKAEIRVNENEIILFIFDDGNISLMRVEAESGEVTHNIPLPAKSKKKKGKQEKRSSGSKGKTFRSASLSEENRLAIAAETEGEVPEAPPFYTVENITPTTISLKWSEVEGADEYRVYETLPFEDKEARRLVAETDDTETTLELDKGDLYFFYLRAVRDGVESDEVYTAIMNPRDIENLDIHTTATKMSVDWTEVVDSTYEVSVFDMEEELDTEELTEPHYSISKLAPLTSYIFNMGVHTSSTAQSDGVLFICMTHPDDGSIDDEEIPDFPDPPEPTGHLPAPEDFTVEPGQTTALLEWKPVEDAEGYVIWINGEKKIEVGDVTEYELQDLTPYTPYEVHLRALDEDGRDGKSSVQSFFTLPDHLDPPEVKVEKVTSISAYLTWKPVKAAKTYTITYNGKSEQLEDEDVKVIGLQERQHYVFTIVAEHRSVKSKPVEVEVETLPFSYLYEYDGSLLETVTSSYEQQWDYQYDKNGNVLKIKYIPVPKTQKQQFDITGQ
ncbi:fibronectin type III domain-containing protein [Brevibacillus choshinensis]|uniref:fibronectin type III domain-containing protein n=1 Tax=Brevibacillus choshinensis TaxID=54911 RepID=UPI002E1D7285|nr:fibronectin type III domain-containing protein [Brevibacillus choshinensis]